MLPICVLLITVAIIYFLGTGSFGRSQTQAWIDHFKSRPGIHGLLDRHHGKLRAAGHYVEFGGLFLVLYWLYDSFWGTGHFAFVLAPAVCMSLISGIAAWLDELHQLRSGGRQFRRVDFLHSCCGIALAAAVVQYQSILRGI